MKNKDEQFEELKKQQLQNLGERLKKLRISKGYTSYEYFAYDHNLPRAQYGRYEKGEDLKFSSLLKVLRALDISLTDFFEEGF
jgi:transcriptional regulator with XRE-family HTH domain